MLGDKRATIAIHNTEQDGNLDRCLGLIYSMAPLTFLCTPVLCASKALASLITEIRLDTSLLIDVVQAGREKPTGYRDAVVTGPQACITEALVSSKTQWEAYI